MNSEMTFSPESIFMKNQGIVTRRITGELFIVPVKGKLADMQRIFTLNPVAEYIWNSLDGIRTLAEIRRDILVTYEIDEAAAASDITEFLTELIHAGLISRQN